MAKSISDHLVLKPALIPQAKLLYLTDCVPTSIRQMAVTSITCTSITGYSSPYTITRHMQPTNYQETIKEALQTLIGVNDSIYNSIVNISMQGELKEFNDAVPIGETHQLDFEIFKNSSDTNIQLLIQLMSKVEETFDTLSNINGIEIEEGE